MIQTVVDVWKMSVNGILGTGVSYYNIAQVNAPIDGCEWLRNAQTCIGMTVGLVTLVFLYFRIVKLRLDIIERRMRKKRNNESK